MFNLKMKIFFSLVLVAVAMSALFLPKSADALAVTVKRVVFEGSKRAEVITIINNSDVAETYRLGWKHFTMSERDGLDAVSEDNLPPGVRPSKDMVKFSPRRFTLPPRGSQQVRMMLRMPGGVEDGEYRSHLWIHPEEPVEPYRDRGNKAKSGKAGVFMKMLAGVSMPVIVRKGNLDFTATIEDMSAVRQGEYIATQFTIVRQGTKSAYGDLDFVCNPGSGDEYLLKFTRGVSVYPETPRRVFSPKVPRKSDKPTCSSMMIRYTETDGFAGEMIGILSEAEAQVQ